MRHGGFAAARVASGIATIREVLAIGLDVAIQLGTAASTAGRIEARTKAW
jgi:hypothetical protein